MAIFEGFKDGYVPINRETILIYLREEYKDSRDEKYRQYHSVMRDLITSIENKCDMTNSDYEDIKILNEKNKKYFLEIGRNVDFYIVHDKIYAFIDELLKEYGKPKIIQPELAEGETQQLSFEDMGLDLI